MTTELTPEREAAIRFMVINAPEGWCWELRALLAEIDRLRDRLNAMHNAYHRATATLVCHCDGYGLNNKRKETNE